MQLPMATLPTRLRNTLEERSCQSKIFKSLFQNIVNPYLPNRRWSLADMC